MKPGACRDPDRLTVKLTLKLGGLLLRKGQTANCHPGDHACPAPSAFVTRPGLGRRESQRGDYVTSASCPVVGGGLERVVESPSELRLGLSADAGAVVFSDLKVRGLTCSPLRKSREKAQQFLT